MTEKSTSSPPASSSPASSSPASSPPAALSPAAPGTVYFIGAGPGAPDLITVRGQAFLSQADLVLYADSLVQESVAGLARKATARVVGSAGLHLDEIVALMVDTAQAGGVVARLHTGDAALYGAIHEQIAALEAAGVPCEVVPGVTAAFAAAARLGVSLTLPDTVQTLILSRIAGRTPVPERENLRGLAAHGASLALYLSIAQIDQVVDELLAGGAYAPHTPVAVVHKVTWPDESLVIGTLADIAARVREAGYTRHALILVSPTLAPALGGGEADGAARSRLYDKTFAHGYRGAAPDDAPAPPDAATSPSGAVVVAVTRRGARLAARLAAELGAALAIPARFANDPTLPPHADPTPYHHSVLEEVRGQWASRRQVVLVMACGVAVRAIAPLLTHKTNDPAVVCLDEAGQSVIPLVGGHRAGANELARRVAALTGGHAAITTASDVQQKPALDMVGQAEGWRIDAASALTHASACLVNDELVGVYVAPALAGAAVVADMLSAADNLVLVDTLETLAEDAYAAALIITHSPLPEQHRPLLDKSVVYYVPALVVGIGCRRGVPAAELRAALDSALAGAGLALESVAALATAEAKADEPGLHELAAALGVPLRVVPHAQIAALDSANFSHSAAREKLDLPGVAEPCAVIASGGGALLRPKQAFARCTVAVAGRRSNEDAERRSNEDAERRSNEDVVLHSRLLASSPPRLSSVAAGHLALISLGPGDLSQMTLAAREALAAADVVIGYRTYVDLVRPLLAPHQQVIAGPMRQEMPRAEQALDMAAAGRRVAVISSGDVGIYAMAAPVFEALHQRGGPAPDIAVFPGVSAFQAAAARLGAPIGHDFCAISLSDLLTPWEVIERRLWAAAAGDFVVALYNPRSHTRTWQLERARAILRTERAADTPVALVRNATRPDETMIRTTLADMDTTQADMVTVVLVGNSQSYQDGAWMVTPRGYVSGRRGRGEDAGTRSGEDAGTRSGEDAGTRGGEDAAAEPLPVYPLTLTKIQDAPVLVVGGGVVAERKVRGLLAAGAAVRLISPDMTPTLRAWAAAGRIVWEQRAYQPGDVQRGGWVLVFAATSERAVNQQVAHESEQAGLLCNSADAPAEGNFHVPASYRGNGLVVAVSTGGASPARAAQVRDSIAEWLHDDG
jgi:cobalt-precorrin 5A hydrolase / precorrin-3B C17-methyltransferase